MFIAYSPRRGQAPSERHVDKSDSLDWLENIALIVRNLMPSQKFQILFLKWLATMVILLVADVVDHRA